MADPARPFDGSPLAVGQPRILFLDYSAGSYWDARTAIFSELRDLGATCLVKSGSVLSAPRDVFSAEYGPHKKGRGRQILRATERTPRDRQAKWVRQFVENIDVEVEKPGLVEQIENLGMDCLAFSRLTDEEWSAIQSVPAVQRMMHARATFDTADPFARYFAWDLLVLVGISTQGLMLTHYEDAPDDLRSIDAEDRLEFTCDRNHDLEPESDGHFYDFGAGYPLAIESGIRLSDIPPELPPAEAIPYQQTPMAFAVDRLPHVGPARISKIDDADSNASIELGRALEQFPDLGQVENKVRTYCLNPDHPEGKFEGFLQAGYDVAEPGHVELLASLLSSALHHPFPIREQRTTADGRIQFTVPVALPATDGGLVTVLTAWVGGAGRPLSLATAYRAAERGDLAGTVAIPEDLVGTTDWARLLAFVSGNALENTSWLDGEGYPFFSSYLWIEHAHPRSKEFATWLRKNTNASAGVFTRSAYGGRVTFTRIPTSREYVSEARAAGQATFAQLLFALADVRTHPELMDV